MWGVCLDAALIADGLFQAVIQYEPTADGLRLLAPHAGSLLAPDKVHPLAAPLPPGPKGRALRSSQTGQHYSHHWLAF